MNYLINAVLIITPLAYITGYSSSFDLGKNFFARSLIIALIYAYGALLVYKGKLEIQSNRWKNPITLAFLGITGVLILSTIFSPTPIYSFFGVYQRQFGLLSWFFIATFFAIIVQNLRPESVKKSAGFIAATAIATSAYGLLQAAGIDPLFSQFSAAMFEGRIYSTLGNPDFLAQFIGPTLPIAVTLALLTKKRTHKALWVIGGLIIFAALLLTQSRASFVGVLSAGFLFFIIAVYKKVISRKKAAIIGLVAVILAIVTFTTPLKNAPLVNRLNLDAINTRSMNSRLVIWSSAVQLIADHPVLGTGIDTFRVYFPQYASPDFFTLEETLNSVADREHNELLQMGVWGGFPAMLLYLALIFFVLRELFRTDPKKYPFKTALGLSFSALIIQNIFTFSLLTHYILLVFLLAGIVTLGQKEKIKKIKIHPKAHYLLVPLSLFCVLIWYQTVLMPLKVDRTYMSVRYGSSSSQEMRENLEKTIELNPYSTFFYYEMIMLFPDSIPWALDHIEAIEGRSMDVIAWHANSRAKVNYAEAETYYLEALSLNPSYTPILKAYADATYATGDCEKAVGVFEDLLEVAPPYWKWKDDFETRTPMQQKSYRIFYKNVPDFKWVFGRLRKCYTKLENEEKAFYYSQYEEPFKGLNIQY